MTTSITLEPMTAEQARALTDQINHAAGELWRLLLESYEREAWRALGYGSWREYATSEFSMSKSHAYRVLDQGRLIQSMQEVAGDDVSPIGEINESQARALKGVPEEDRVEVFEKAAAETNGKPTAAAITEVACARDPNTSDVPAEFADYDPEDDAPDPHDEWERAEKEVARLQDVIESLQSGDVERELVAWSAKYARLEGRVHQLTTEGNTAKRQAKSHGALLQKIVKELGVEKFGEIVPAIRDLRR